MEEPVTFKNKANQRLFGIVHTPSGGAREDTRIGVNILNPGLKNRVAPNRLNVKIARMLCEQGFPVLRFDPFGIGDSEGELARNNENVMDLWGMIQRGAFVEDTICANNFFIEKANLDKLILIGQCGAGVTALLCAEKDKRIDGLIVIDTPFRVVGAEMEPLDIAAEYSEAGEVLTDALRSFFHVQKLRKLVTLKVNWRLYLRTIVSLVYFAGKKRGNYVTPKVSDRFNWEMAKAFESFTGRNKRIYFLFAENDFSFKEFQQDFRPNFLNKDKVRDDLYSVDIIKNANHIYTEIEWQNELIHRVLHRLEGSA
jgi:pimeloyl-ACP methyl ester carboxylesterase